MHLLNVVQFCHKIAPVLAEIIFSCFRVWLYNISSCGTNRVIGELYV